MNDPILILSLTAASLGLVHTLAGPDHYLPFVMMGRAGGWSHFKTLWITFFCGIGHVLGSVVIGLVGIGFGIGLSALVPIESFRADLAAWALLAFGLVYLVWGIKRAYRNKPHVHLHRHSDGSIHRHPHRHADEHAHVHHKKGSITPWALFVLFVLGPCEPLIPLLIYPAAQQSLWGLTLITFVFALTTVLTMLVLVAFGLWGAKWIKLGSGERFVHAFAGSAIVMSALSILFLGL